MNRIRNLDGLRGLAILLVVAGHLATNYPGLPAASRDWLMNFANSGMGVRLFFALSGYLITELLLREQEDTGGVRLGAFYLRRARRILPAFYLFLAALAVVIWMAPNSPTLPGSAWSAAALFVWNYSFLWTDHGGANLWSLAHTWSLAVEAQFYLIWPLVLLRLGSVRSLHVLLGLLLLAPALRVGTYLLFPGQRGLIGMMLHTGYDGIVAGCASALLARNAGAVAWLGRHSAAGCALAVGWILVGGPILNHSVRGFPIVAGFTLDALSAAMLTASAHLAPPRWVARVLGGGFLPALGAISYSLYLWQQIFLGPDGPLREGRLLVAVAAPAILACASYRLVERPFLRRPCFASHQSQAAAAPHPVA